MRESKTTTTTMSGVALIAAVGALFAFGALTVFLITKASADEVLWTRLAWIFASVEAIAFGAAGALFGSSIQRGRAERAEATSERNATDAANGRALATVLKSESGGSDAESDEFLDTEASVDVANVVSRHASLARELFP